ncbi:MAG: serine/threonine-protein kinase [Myxococcota bacterium]
MSESSARFCPVCGRGTDEERCPHDRVPTIERALLPEAPSHLPEGTIIADRYRVERKLGGGGMGTVYAATQLSMRRAVALKVVNSNVIDEDGLRRFYREAQSASQIHHPNVVGVHDFGFDPTRKIPFLAMEMVSGQTLRKLLDAEAPLAPDRAMGITEQIARGLVATHEAGVIHRDLKPRNVMVRRLADGDEHVTVLDFGIAKVPLSEDQEATSPLTRPGLLVGTPAYMSPEQAEGEPATEASDLYSLGCLLHEMLTGRPPFTAESVGGLLKQHLLAPRPAAPTQVRDEAVPRGLDRVHGALLQIDASGRPRSVAAVARALRRLQADPRADITPGDLGRFGEPTTGAGDDTHPSLTGGETHSHAFPGWRWGTGGRAAVVIALVLLAGLSAWQITLALEPPEPVPEVVALPPEAEAPSAPAPSPEPPAPSTFTLSTVPSGAQVFVDGDRVGQTPLELEAEDVLRKLSLRRRGYKTRVVDVDAGRADPIEIRLEKVRRAAPPPLPNPYD